MRSVPRRIESMLEELRRLERVELSLLVAIISSEMPSAKHELQSSDTERKFMH
jgi:hypothetical protein